MYEYSPFPVELNFGGFGDLDTVLQVVPHDGRNSVPEKVESAYDSSV